MESNPRDLWIDLELRTLILEYYTNISRSLCKEVLVSVGTMNVYWHNLENNQEKVSSTCFDEYANWLEYKIAKDVALSLLLSFETKY